MKRFLSLLLTVTILFTMFVTVAQAEAVTPSANLISVAYSEKLDLYVTVASDGQLYTSGDGLNWGPGVKLAPSVNLGSIVGNGYYVTPDVIIWNPDMEEFVLTAGNKLYRSTDGFNWGEAITPLAGNSTLVIHTLFWDGSKYWAATTTGGQVAYANDSTLTSWTATSTGANKAIDGFAKASTGRLFVCTTLSNSKTLYYTDDDGATWTDGTTSGSGINPYRTTSIQYSKKLEKILLAGGNGSNAASTGDAAMGRADVVTGLTESRVQLKANTTYPQVPVISDFVAYDTYNTETNEVTKEELISVSYTGAIRYRLVIDATDIAKNNKWFEVAPASGEAENTVGLTSVIRGKNGYVAVGGDPSNHDRTSNSGAVAIFIPTDYAQGYTIGNFDDNTTKSAYSFYVNGADEIGIPESEPATATYTVAVRDVAGKPIENPSNTVVWTVSGENTDGITIEDGVLSVASTAKEQKIVITATDSENGNIYGEKTVIIVDSVAPSSIQVIGAASVVKSEISERTSTYSAAVLDQLGRDVPEEMGGVVWSLTYPDSEAADGISIDAQTGLLSVPSTATPGIVYVTATSAVEGYETVSKEFSVTVTSVGSVILSGPSTYYHYFKQTTKTPCSYTFAPSVKDSKGNTIVEECEYSIAESYNNPGISLSTAANGDCVISINKNAVSDKLTLVAKVKNAPEITGTFDINVVDTMVPNGDLFEENSEGVEPINWTNTGTLVPTKLDTNEHHGRWIFQIGSASAQDYVSYQSDAFAVAPNATYKFGFRSGGVKIPTHDDSFTPILYMLVMFTDESGEYVGDPIFIFDTYINEGKAHSTTIDFYETVTVPENAVSAQITMSATPPLEFSLFDIGCYPLVDSGDISISGESSVEAGNSIQLTAAVENLMYNEQSIPLPDGVRWFLKESYSGVSVDAKTGEIAVSKNAKAGKATVVAVVSGNTEIVAEKEVEIIVKEFVVNELTVSEEISAGATVSAQAKIYNSTDDSAYVNVFVAVYSAQGVLEYCGISEYTQIVNDSTEKTLGAYVDIPSGTDTEGWFAKAFVWSDMIPVKQR